MKKGKHTHYSPSHKMEIIKLVEESDLGVVRTLKELQINKATFYKWYNAYLEGGYDGLARRKSEKGASLESNQRS